MMPRPRKPILILGTVGIAFAAIYVNARPNWRMLTEAELRATLKPELLLADPIDIDAQNRYRQFVKILTSPDHGKGQIDLAEREIERRIRKRTPKIHALENLVSEGPFQNPEREYGERRYLPMYLAKKLADCFIAVARSQATGGDHESATRNYLTAIRIAEQTGHGAADWTGLSYQSRTHQGLAQALFTPPIGLTDSELGQIANAIPRSTLKDPASRRMVLRDSQRIYSALVDPIGWYRKTMPKDTDPEQMLDRFMVGNLMGLDGGAVLTYDARETAEHFNHVIPTLLANTDRSFRDQDTTYVKYASRLTSEYPANGAAGKTGSELWLKKMEYRWATARVRNGLGNRVVEMMCWYFEVSSREASFFRRTLTESVRTRIALQRYRLRYGRPAPDLASLVKTGLLAGLPLDPYDGASLRYDAARKRLWSVGENGKDDKGTGKPLGDRRQPDIIWETL